MRTVFVLVSALMTCVGCISHDVGFGPGVAEVLKERLRADELMHVILLRRGEAYRIDRGALVDARHALVHAILEAEPDRTPPDPGLGDIGISLGDSVHRLPYTGRTVTFHYEDTIIRVVRYSSNRFEVWWRKGNVSEGYLVPDAAAIGRAWSQLERQAAANAKATTWRPGWTPPDLEGFYVPYGS